MSVDQHDRLAASERFQPLACAQSIGEFLQFLQAARDRLKRNPVSEEATEVKEIRAPVEDHYVDDSGKPAMYLQFESALYDDARSIVTLWDMFQDYSLEELRTFRDLATLELDGLNGDRHPRKVFDRSPLGIAALIAGTVTIWMTVLRTYTGEDLSELLELVRFNWIAGAMWIVGLFVVVWFILRTHRNNCQVAHLATLVRALDLYLK